MPMCRTRRAQAFEFQASADLAQAQPFGAQLRHALADVVGYRSLGAAPVDACGLASSDGLTLALADEPALELREDGRHVCHGLSVWRGRIHSRVQADDLPAARR